MRIGPLPGVLFFVLCSGILAGCAEGPVRKTYEDDWASRSKARDSVQSDALKKAQSFYAQGELEKALAALNEAQEPKLSPAEKTAYWNLKGLIRLGTRNTSAAIVNFKKAIVLNPYKEYTGYYQLNLATAFADASNFEESKRILDRIDSATMAAPDRKKLTSLRERVNQRMSAPAGAASIAVVPVEAGSASGALAAGALSSDEVSPPLDSASVDATPVEARKIGLLLPLSGKYENFGKKAQRSIELAFQSSTAPVSKTLELIPVDAGETTESHLQALKKLVEEDHVIAIIGPVLSKSLDAIRARAERYQVPLVSLAQVQIQTESPIFSCSVSARDQIAKAVEYAMNSRNFRRFAVLAPANKAGESLAHLFWDEAQARGAEIRGFELYDPELTDFREPVDKLIGLFYTETRTKELNELAEKRKELNITKKTMKTLQFFNLPPIVDFDAVFIADEAKTSGQIIPTFAYRDAKGIRFFGISSWNSPQLVKRAGDLAEGAFFPVAFNTLNPPEATKRFHDLYLTTYQAPPGELDAVAFDAATVVIQAASRSPRSRPEFTRELESSELIEGATGMIQMRNHQCVRTLSIYEVKKGSFEVTPASGG